MASLVEVDDVDRRLELAIDALAAAGSVEVTQRGEVVDVASAHGPVRVRRPR